MSSSPRQTRNRERVKARLIDAGRQLGSTFGPGALTVEAVTEVADVAVSTFYSNFTSRESFETELREGARAVMLADVGEALKLDRPPHHELAMLTRRLLDRKDRDRLAVTFGAAIEDNIVFSRGEIDALFVRSFEAGCSSGLFSGIDDIELAVVTYRGALRSATSLGAASDLDIAWKSVVAMTLGMLGLDREAVAEAVMAAAKMS